MGAPLERRVRPRWWRKVKKMSSHTLFWTALLVWSGLCAGNFIWQALGQHNWAQAAERSFFQLVPLLLLVFIHYARRGG